MNKMFIGPREQQITKAGSISVGDITTQRWGEVLVDYDLVLRAQKLGWRVIGTQGDWICMSRSPEVALYWETRNGS